MRPDTAIFSQHLSDTYFRSQVDRGIWGIHGDDVSFSSWPVVIIWVKAAPKPGRPDRYFFRFDLSGYPSVAPTACPWDITKNARLDSNSWPRGSKFVNATFNYGWNANALYAPCDRVAQAGHDNWRNEFSELWWNADHTITLYLNFLYQLLNSSDYANS